MPSKLLKCSCESEFQDKMYGPSIRLHTYTMKDATYRCTCCGKTQTSGKTKDDKKKQQSAKNAEEEK